jgi:antitoxin VapB
MRTVSIFKNNANQAVRIPKDMQFEGVTELEIQREGDTILLRPVRPNWMSFAAEPAADADFLAERPEVIQTGRFDFSDIDDKAGEPRR